MFGGGSMKLKMIISILIPVYHDNSYLETMFPGYLMVYSMLQYVIYTSSYHMKNRKNPFFPYIF